MPVLWHQSLLTFVQRYKSDVSTEQKEALLELLKKHTHHDITNEIRRELASAKCRDLENEDANSQHSVDLNLNDNEDFILDYWEDEEEEETKIDLKSFASSLFLSNFICFSFKKKIKVYLTKI